jgi:hypothetical protein
MTIKGNVLVCDECGRQVSMPMQRDAGAKESLDARVRVHAVELGWQHAGQLDSCPDHVGERA